MARLRGILRVLFMTGPGIALLFAFLAIVVGAAQLTYAIGAGAADEVRDQRDQAILERDRAIEERDQAIADRDRAIASIGKATGQESDRAATVDDVTKSNRDSSENPTGLRAPHSESEQSNGNRPRVTLTAGQGFNFESERIVGENASGVDISLNSLNPHSAHAYPMMEYGGDGAHAAKECKEI